MAARLGKMRTGIIGVLAAIVIPKIAGRGEDARVQAAKTQISSFGTALDMFEVDNGYYPKGAAGLNDLLQTPRDATNWKGPYLKSEIPLDPWNKLTQLVTRPSSLTSQSVGVNFSPIAPPMG